MKNRYLFIFLFFLPSLIFSQNINFGANYSGSISSASYSEYSNWIFRTDLVFPKNRIGIGFQYAIVNSSFRGPKQVIDAGFDGLNIGNSLSFGIKINYYLVSLYNLKKFDIVPFITGAINYEYKHFGNYRGLPGLYPSVITAEPNFNYNFGLGILLFPTYSINPIFEMGYQIRSFEVQYSIPYNFELTNQRFDETLNLNSILWNIGIQINLGELY